MSKSDQVLIIEPATELKFVGPFTAVVVSELRLINPSAKRVAFKVKTTAPKRYCVRPNSGLIEPGGKVVVSVMLQPFQYDPDEKNNHKFMVQSLYAAGATVETLDQLWKDAGSGQLMDSKLKCVFELPAGQDPVLNTFDMSTDDNIKPSPAKPVTNDSFSVKPTGSSVGGGLVNEEVKRVQAECRSLSAEIQRLREDNSKLRDEGIRLRKIASTTPSYTSSSSSMPASSTSQSATMSMSVDSSILSAQPPIAYLIAMLILGIIIGKFLL